MEFQKMLLQALLSAFLVIGTIGRETPQPARPAYTTVERELVQPAIVQPAIVIQRETAHPSANYSYVYDHADLATLKMTQIIFRHGPQTPDGTYRGNSFENLEEYYGVKGAGQLTPRGEALSYNLGHYLRRRYDGFLNSNYSVGEVYAQSMPFDKTYMSAAMCLAGLYPIDGTEAVYSLNWRPIPIYSTPSQLDTKLSYSVTCPRLVQLQTEELNGPRFHKYTRHGNPELFEVLDERIGDNLDWAQLVQLAETLEIQYEAGRTLPAWTRGIYPEILGPLLDEYKSYSAATPEMARLRVGPLMAEALQNVELKIHGKTQQHWSHGDVQYYHKKPAKSYLYAVDDTTLAVLLKALGADVRDPPFYTAAIMAELHSQGGFGRDENAYIIRIFYKKHTYQPAIELPLPKCGKPCTLAKFRRSYGNLVLGEEEWKSECNNVQITQRKPSDKRQLIGCDTAQLLNNAPQLIPPLKKVASILRNTNVEF